MGVDEPRWPQPPRPYPSSCGHSCFCAGLVWLVVAGDGADFGAAGDLSGCSLVGFGLSVGFLLGTGGRTPPPESNETQDQVRYNEI